MEKIKFSGKRLKDGKWVYGFYYAIGEYHYIHSVRKLFSDSWESNTYQVDPATVGQYTGLKDKNGVEIYEGSIYHMGDKNIRYRVVWHDTGLIGKQIGSSSYAGLRAWLDVIEVLGNIHDNPELLGGAD